MMINIILPEGWIFLDFTANSQYVKSIGYDFHKQSFL